MRFCRGLPKHMNCCLKKPLNFALWDAQQLRTDGTRITEEETQYKAGARKSLDLHHRPEAGLKRGAVKEVYSRFLLCRRCDTPHDDSMLPGGEISVSRWSRNFKLIDAVKQGDFRRIGIRR